MVPDPIGAAKYVFADLKTTFTAAAPLPRQAADGLAFNSHKRYAWVKKRFTARDARQSRNSRRSVIIRASVRRLADARHLTATAIFESLRCAPGGELVKRKSGTTARKSCGPWRCRGAAMTCQRMDAYVLHPDHPAPRFLTGRRTAAWRLI